MNPWNPIAIDDQASIDIRQSAARWRLAIRYLACAMFWWTVPTALAQSGGGFDLTWSAVTGGAQTSTAGGFAVSGTVGQHDAGTPMADAGGVYEVTGGFWVVQTPCTCELYGDVVATCVVDVDDILYVLNSFADPGSFPKGDLEPCGGDDDVDVDDILAELNAFAGIFACPHPCPSEVGVANSE